MVRFLLFISLILVLESCILDHRLTLDRQYNDTDALKLDGIYLHHDSLDIVDLFYLYPNGTILSRGSVRSENLETKLARLENSNDEKYKSMKYLWGRYIIENNTITFEKWAPTDKPYRAFRRTGKVINDTTFIINQFSDVKGKSPMVISEKYKYRKTKSKPDNRNKWVDPKKGYSQISKSHIE